MIGTKLDRFELIAELASGGMGTVFLARLGGAGGFQRLYAIKRLHEHLARHSEFIEMFLDEARRAARIHHPNVVPILEIGTTDAGHYLVMEYVEGDTAGHLFHAASQEKKAIPPRVAVRIVLDVLAGLHAAHEGTDDEGRLLEVVHRDVSPHNILVSVDGVARITDFGIARAASRLAVTRTGQLKGKIAYMAPEQARSEKIDRRADVFATGICLWEMLAGRRLFKAEAEGETLNRLLYEPIPALDCIDPPIPRELAEVCAKALTRDLSKRYSTAADFSDALETAARSLDVLGTHRDVAACIADVLGVDLSERRADLRAWIADTERKSLVPPAESGPDAGLVGLERVRGAHVSAYVPSLFESGSLGAHAGSDFQPHSSRSKPPRVRRAALVALVAIAATAIVVRWSHGRAAATSALTEGQGVQPTAPVVLPRVPVETAVEPAPSRDDAPSATPAPSEVFLAATPSSAASARAATPQHEHATVVAVGRPPRLVNGPSQSPEVAPPPSASVPRDMLYNPYR
jgi:serine/threonine protein kinase